MSEKAELQALYAKLESSPEDPLTLSALADWFEEHDAAQMADCLRWLVEMGKVPFRYSHKLDLKHHYENWNENWYWWATARERAGWGYPKACRLPHTLWERMKHTFDYDPAVFKEYKTVRSAIEAVLAAWTRRPPTPPPKKAKPG